MKRENFSSIDYLIHFLIHECFVSTGEIAPVGPTSFEFVVPEGSPLTISPSVGTIEPGKVLIVGLSIRKIYYWKDLSNDIINIQLLLNQKSKLYY